jgi:putative ABC transport system permease protein
MVRLTLRTLRYRKGGFIATFIALFFGAAIVMACGGLMETGVRTAVAPQRLAGADIVVTADRYVDLPTKDPSDEEKQPKSALLTEQVALNRGVLGKVSTMAGVAEAVPDVAFPAALGSDVTSGHGWQSARLAPHTLTGAEPGPGQVVLDASTGRHVGEQVDISVRGVTKPFTVSGVGTFPQPVMFFSGPDALRLGKLMSIGVVVQPGTDVAALAEQLKATLVGDATILTGEDRGTAEFPAAVSTSETLIVLAGVFGGFAVMVLMLVVASTLGLSIQQRNREIALLRAVGATPGQVRRMVFVEALVVSALATGAAWYPGSILGRWLFNQLAGRNVVSPMIEFHQGWVPSVTGVGVALVGAQVAAVAAARRAARTRPTEALAEAAVQRKWLTATRVIISLLAFGGGTALAIVTVTAMTGPIAASTAGPAVLLWAIGMTLLAPGATRIVMSVLHWPVRAMTSVSGYLAMSNARVRRVQLASAVAPVMLATGFAVAQIYTQTTSVEVSQQAYAENLRADAVLISTTGGVSSSLVDSVRGLPGVAAASEWVTSTGFLDGSANEDGLALQGVSAAGAAQLTAMSLAAGSLTDLRGDTVALPTSEAHSVGEKVSIRFGDGQVVPLKVVATVNARVGFEAALLPASLLAVHTTAGAPTQIMVRASGDPAQLTATLADFARRTPGLQVADRAVLTAVYAEGQQTSAWINYLLAGMIILYTAISVINTLVVSTAARRREFGLLRLSGARRGQVLRMAGIEGAVVAIAGIVLGTLISAGTLVPFSIAAAGTPFPSGPLWIYLAVAGAAGLLTMSATLLPAWFAIRARPVDTVVAP